jgi:hypothetical protein
LASFITSVTKDAATAYNLTRPEFHEHNAKIVESKKPIECGGGRDVTELFELPVKTPNTTDDIWDSVRALPARALPALIALCMEHGTINVVRATGPRK